MKSPLLGPDWEKRLDFLQSNAIKTCWTEEVKRAIKELHEQIKLLKDNQCNLHQDKSKP